MAPTPSLVTLCHCSAAGLRKTRFLVWGRKTSRISCHDLFLKLCYQRVLDPNYWGHHVFTCVAVLFFHSIYSPTKRLLLGTFLLFKALVGFYLWRHQSTRMLAIWTCPPSTTAGLRLHWNENTLEDASGHKITCRPFLMSSIICWCWTKPAML